MTVTTGNFYAKTEDGKNDLRNSVTSNYIEICVLDTSECCMHVSFRCKMKGRGQDNRDCRLQLEQLMQRFNSKLSKNVVQFAKSKL